MIAAVATLPSKGKFSKQLRNSHGGPCNALLALFVGNLQNIGKCYEAPPNTGAVEKGRHLNFPLYPYFLNLFHFFYHVSFGSSSLSLNSIFRAKIAAFDIKSS